MDLLHRLSNSITLAHSPEALVRPLLEMLEQVTHLESTYLTMIDFPQEVQHVLYAHNTQQMQIPEGLSVPWNDTLCQRALQEGRTCTSNVQACWGDSQAAQALGICTYISAPVRFSDGSIYGTLCAASAQAQSLPEDTEVVLQLFANLIGQSLEREKLLEELHQRNRDLSAMALTDPLTQLPNRTALIAELQRLLARAQRSGESVVVAFIDLDGFKQVNDQYGHRVGDCLLQRLSQQLQASLRAGDVLARFGGDEFVWVGAIDAGTDSANQALSAIDRRLRDATVCGLSLDDGQWLHYPGASIGVVCVDSFCGVDEALQQADHAMYGDKSQRRASRGGVLMETRSPPTS